MTCGRLCAPAGNGTVEFCGFGIIDKLHRGPWLNAAVKEQRNAQFATSREGHSPPLCEELAAPCQQEQKPCWPVCACAVGLGALNPRHMV